MNMQLAQKSKLNSMLAAWPSYFKDADRQEVAGKVERCVDWLHLQGFDVCGVQVGTRNPRITIRHSPLCEKLEGAVRRFERVGLVEMRYWVAIRFDCEVRWVDGGEQ